MDWSEPVIPSEEVLLALALSVVVEAALPAEAALPSEVALSVVAAGAASQQANPLCHLALFHPTDLFGEAHE